MRGSEDDAQAAASLMSDALPGNQRVRAERVNPLTGSPVTLAAENVPPSGEPLIDRALDFVQRQVARGFGFAPEESPEFVPDPHVQQTAGGVSVVHLHQQYHGIPIFEMTRSVQFGEGNRIERVVGDNCSLEAAIDTAPKITAAQALLIAARYLAENEDEEAKADHWGQVWEAPRLEIPSGYEPQVVAAFDRPNRPTVLDKGPFGEEVQASLVVFYRGEDTRLAWKLRIRLAENAGEYVMLVAADREITGPVSSDTNNSLVLLCKDTMTTAVRGSVFLHNPGQAGRSLVDFPRLANTYPLT
jgi:extracellular elastinolytic metalloproteinase